MGAVGVAHQVGWLIRSDEPMLKPRRHLGLLRYPLKEKSMELFVCAEEARWDLETTRREFLKGEAARPSRPNVFEDLHVLFFEGTNGQLAGGLIFHRDRIGRFGGMGSGARNRRNG